MLLVLFALFFRPVGFDYRSKIADSRWRNTWDWGLFVGGAIPALLFGVAFGNVILGVPFQLDEFLRPTYTGSFFGLLRPFALLAGVVSLSMLMAHGAVWLHMRAGSAVQERARKATIIAALVMFAAFSLAGIWLAMGIDGYRIISQPALDALPNPLAKTVEIAEGAWMTNYSTYPWMVAAPLLGLGGAVATAFMAWLNRPGLGFVTSSLAMSGVILTAGFSMFPFVMPSITVPSSSLTLWDAPSSHLTLTVMFWAAMIFVPIILAYTVWTYRVMWGRVTVEHIRQHEHEAY
jgi:cytochrome d ubiquinol oxidase subunit II